MNKTIAISFAALLALPLQAAPQISSAAKASPEKLATESPIVAGVALLKINDTLRNISNRTNIELTHDRAMALGWTRVTFTANKEETRKFLLQLNADPGVEKVSEERLYQSFAQPNDPSFTEMWHLQSIGMEQVWDTSTGALTQRIGVVDTGTLRNHEDLASKDITGYDFIASADQGGDGNGRDADYEDSGDGADCGRGFQPSSYHGSHVAGTILGATNNNVGIAGVNWNAGLVTVRALGKCGGNLSDIIEGALWLVGAEVPGVPTLAVEDRVSVMNLSLGGFGACSAYEQDAVDFINNQGAIFVAASGNDGGIVNSPANCEDVITVAAHGVFSSLTNYSSFDSSVEIVAPGGETLNALNQAVLSATGPENNAYTWNQGTSMAAPHVAGAISILQDVAPNLTRLEIVELMHDTGGACAGCSGKRALRLDRAITVAMGGSVSEIGEHSSPETAIPIQCDTTLSRETIPGQETYFVIEGQNGTSVDVNLSAAGDFDLDLYISRPDGTEITSSTSPDGQESATVLINDTTYLQVVPFQEARGNYSIGIECTDVGDDFEPNSTIEEAANLECNTTADLYMFPEDRDWFLLDVNEGERFDLNIVADGEFDLDVYVTTSQSRRDVIAEGTSPSGNEIVSGVVGLAQPVYAVVIPFRDATGSYRMRLSCPDREPVVVEPEVPEAEEEIGPSRRGEEPDVPETGCQHMTSGDPDTTGPVVALLALFGVVALAFRRRVGLTN